MRKQELDVAERRQALRERQAGTAEILKFIEKYVKAPTERERIASEEAVREFINLEIHRHRQWKDYPEHYATLREREEMAQTQLHQQEQREMEERAAQQIFEQTQQESEEKKEAEHEG